MYPEHFKVQSFIWKFYTFLIIVGTTWTAKKARDGYNAVPKLIGFIEYKPQSLWVIPVWLRRNICGWPFLAFSLYFLLLPALHLSQPSCKVPGLQASVSRRSFRRTVDEANFSRKTRLPITLFIESKQRMKILQETADIFMLRLLPSHILWGPRISSKLLEKLHCCLENVIKIRSQKKKAFPSILAGTELLVCRNCNTCIKRLLNDRIYTTEQFY